MERVARIGILGVLLLLIALPLLILQVQHQQNTLQHAAGTSGYSVSGKQIIDSNGKEFVPYSIDIVGLSGNNWQNSEGNRNISQNEIIAAHDYWHANTIRVQFDYENLFNYNTSNSSNPNGIFIGRLDQIIGWADSENMNVILSLQTESTANNPFPDQKSIDVWNKLAPYYKTNPTVWFDIFNEPRCWTGNAETSWGVWQNGGVCNGVTYMGMQNLVDTIRNAGANNIIIAEGLAGGESLQGLVTGEGTTTAHVLTGGNIVYAVHPYFGQGATYSHLTVGDWDTWFGNAARKITQPVMVGEWDVYDSSKPGCISGTIEPQQAPVFLSYLDSFSFHIGVDGWGLVPGTLIRGDGTAGDAWNFTNPTKFDNATPPTFSCPSNWQYPNPQTTAQGVGADLVAYFTLHNPTTTLTPTPTDSVLPPSLTPTRIPSITIAPIPSATITLTPIPSLTPKPSPTLTPTRTPSVTPIPPTTTIMPTTTPMPQSTSIGLTLLLQGIYNAGDKVNPTGGNPVPAHQQRTVTVSLYDGSNNLRSSIQGLVTYSRTNGNFAGTLSFPSANISSGNYLVKVSVPHYLTTQIAGIQTILSGNINQLPITSLVVGDVDSDNRLTILDYNALFNCLSSFGVVPPTCSPSQYLAADLNDDGIIDELDYNLFLRELSVQQGQ